MAQSKHRTAAVAEMQKENILLLMLQSWAGVLVVVHVGGGTNWKKVSLSPGSSLPSENYCNADFMRTKHFTATCGKIVIINNNCTGS